MAREAGSVNSSREATIEVRLISGEAIECVVDTGFDGGLMLPRAFVEQVQIPIVGRLAFEMVGGTRLFAQVGLGSIHWLREVRPVEIVVSDSSDALIGTELLQKTLLTIDYVSAKVTISTTAE